MSGARRHPARAAQLLVAGSLVAVLLSLLIGSATAAPSDAYTTGITPADVVPSGTGTYTIALNNLNSSTDAANNGHVEVPAEFTVDPATLVATTTTAGTCSEAGWTVTFDAPPLPPVIHAISPPGAENALCPGGTLLITFSATAPATEGSYSWPTTLALDTTQFALRGAQPAVTVDGTAPPTPIISSSPPDPSTSSTASFSFTDGDATATLLCQLDGGAFSACTSPTTYTGLADGAHTFAVMAADAAGNQSAAASMGWTIDATPPPSPTLVAMPPTVTASTSASFSFTDDDASASFLCNLDGAGFSACTSPQGYAGLSAGSHLFEVKARDPVGNESTPTSYTWVIDLTNPVVTIDPATEPSNPTNTTQASFEFTSNKAGSSFECALDGGGFASCTSPAGYSGLADGAHQFAVRATDSLGTTGPATVWSWTIDTVAPSAPAITSAPRSQTNSRTAIVVFHGGETGLSFSCRLDGGAFAACGSPISYGNLADGAHSFTVRSKDAAGNVGPAAARGWVVDTRPPHTSITGAPPNVSSTASATFAFASSEASSFSCSLDGGAFSACSSPRSYGGLSDGGHIFRVRATDLAGNADPAPPAYSWQVLALLPPDTTPPGKVKRLKVAVRYGFLRLTWLPPADTDLDHVQIQRRRSATGGTETTVYQGRGRKYTDRRFENGSYFMYRVKSYDGAGNGSRAANVPVSPAALLTAPRDGRVVRGSVQLAWAAVPHAGYYNVQLYRGAQKLLSAWPAKARRALAKRWVYQGRQVRLAKGFYRWYVWPGFGARLQAKYGHLLGTGTFAVR